MKLAAIVLLTLAATSAPTYAGDHGSHPPMGPPLSVTCALLPAGQQFACLHPGYTLMLADLRGLSHTFSSTQCPNRIGFDNHGYNGTICVYVPV